MTESFHRHFFTDFFLIKDNNDHWHANIPINFIAIHVNHFRPIVWFELSNRHHTHFFQILQSKHGNRKSVEPYAWDTPKNMNITSRKAIFSPFVFFLSIFNLKHLIRVKLSKNKRKNRLNGSLRSHSSAYNQFFIKFTMEPNSNHSRKQQKTCKRFLWSFEMKFNEINYVHMGNGMCAKQTAITVNFRICCIQTNKKKTTYAFSPVHTVNNDHRIKIEWH